ncbi:hypothetical protein D3H55_22915 [Bacillus salacetis]|uniref:Enhanced intracellular survival protein domain-containing protein n=1 Tax=Bacillus salacetis TaxID=2315464 RepID=A0A3A1QLV1_9BACI|nr:sterol carrier protein domain-containing protein [Bacillus salacetis]RIW27461.1 hypothetical protein D3H55_22915 [Bacillus salacetis]
MLSRGREWWKERTISSLNAAIYYDSEGKGKGYLLYVIRDQRMKVEEFVALNAEARSGLWNFICQHDSMLSEVELNLSPDDPLVFLLDNPRVSTELHPYFMARIVDVPAFLTLIQPAFTQEVSFRVTDRYAPWNNGTFTITPEKVSIENEQRAQVVEMDVNALVPLFFGMYSSRELYEMDVLKGDTESIAALEGLKVNRGFFYDFF